ncbi:MAG: type I methionyl aminopeptidase [Mycobacteriales bacterium]
MITIKTADEIERMRDASRVVALALQAVAANVRVGATPIELDALAADVMREHRAQSSFQGYHPSWAPTPFPAVTCMSVNDVIVHGIPDERPLQLGDVVSVDCGASIAGYHGDAAMTIVVGEGGGADAALSDATRRALHAGIHAAVPGARLGDLGAAIAEVGRAAGYGILADHGGHGIGTAMHEDPHIPNTGRAGRGVQLVVGMVIALEPMFHAGGGDGYRKLADGWSVATEDGSNAAHWEHTIAITADGPRVLTTL